MKNRNTVTICTTILLACFGFLPGAQPVVPAPDGGYPGFNTAEGQNALFSLTTGQGNTAVGWHSLFSNTEGSFNTATGAGTLLFNAADANTAFGTAALLFNTTGNNNTAVGATALLSNTEGSENTANGAYALYSNTTGAINTAVGVTALSSNTAGSFNTAIGVDALLSNTEGFQNTATGRSALRNNTDGSFNTASGYQALHNTTGFNNTAIGSLAGANATTGTGNVYVGSGVVGVPGESNSTYIRNINATNVSGAGTDTVTVNLSTGLLGHLSSSRRYKEDIEAMESASETLYRLKPVTYRYKKEIDPSQSLDYGLVAEDVAKVDPNLANRNRDGQIESVRYNAINAMLLNEFLKEHRKVENVTKDFQATVAQQQKEIQALTAQLKEQAAQIQRVSAQVEVSQFATGRIRRGGPAPRVVNNP